jgi:hypothetical protein
MGALMLAQWLTCSNNYDSFNLNIINMHFFGYPPHHEIASEKHICGIDASPTGFDDGKHWKGVYTNLKLFQFYLDRYG